MWNPDNHIAGSKVRIGKDIAHVVHRRERHLAAEMLQQFLLGALACECGDGGNDLVLIGAAVLHRRQARIDA